MKNKIIIISYQFHEDNLKLQPWRYVFELAKRLPNLNWSTIIITDSCFGDKKYIENVIVKDSFTLSPVAQNSILKVINKISPDVILWPLGEKSIAYRPLFKKLKSRVMGYVPGPILSFSDFQAACRAKLLNESFLATSWILARKLGWGKIMSSCCDEFVVLSEANRIAMVRMGIDERRIHVITAGHDSHEERPNHTAIERLQNNGEVYSNEEKIALFMGWPTRVRGIELLLNAFAIVARQNKKLTLKILARGDDTDAHKKLHCLVKQHPASEKIKVIEGFLPKENVLRHISECDFGVLPFIQVPADRPLSFLEFFAAGKPVVATDATGIPELIGDTRGIIARRGNPRYLAKALIKMASMPDSDFSEYREACLSFIRHYPDWDESALQLARVIAAVS